MVLPGFYNIFFISLCTSLKAPEKMKIPLPSRNGFQAINQFINALPEGFFDLPMAQFLSSLFARKKPHCVMTSLTKLACKLLLRVLLNHKRFCSINCLQQLPVFAKVISIFGHPRQVL